MKNPKKKNLTVSVSLSETYQEMLKFIMEQRYVETKSAMIKTLIKKEYEQSIGK